MPAGSTLTTHILKPSVPGFEDQNINEHLCLTAAGRLGLSVANSRIRAFEDEVAIVVERFDRVDHNSALVRGHQGDLCQALWVPPVRKYQPDGGPTLGKIADLLRSTIPGSNAETDVWRFVDALVSNWLIAGTDAHAKNYSLLLAQDQVRLAPLYDIASIFPYDDSDGHNVKLAMKVGDDYKLRRTDRLRAWERAANEPKVDPTRLLERVLDFAARTPAAFEQAVEGADLNELKTDMPERLTDLVAKRCLHCAGSLSLRNRPSSSQNLLRPRQPFGSFERLRGYMDLVSPENSVESVTARFDALFNEQYASMVRVATFLVDHQAIAEEIVQESFGRLWQTFGSVEEPLAYLRRSVVNRSHGELRRRRVRRLHPDPLTSDAAEAPDYILDLLAALPVRKRTALVLRFYAGMSNAEIAHAMSISTGTVKSTIHRALADIRKALT